VGFNCSRSGGLGSKSCPVGLHWPLVLVKVKVMVYGVQRVERSSAFDAEGRTGAWMRGRRATCVVRCEVLMSASARRGIGKGVRCSGVYTVASGTDLGEDSNPCSVTRSCCR